MRSGMLVWLAMAMSLGAAELKPETMEAWDQYVRAADSEMHNRAHAGRTFLWMDETSDRAERVRAGETLTAPFAAHTPVRVPAGLIHHWIGVSFLPDAKIADVVAIERDYARYKDYYRPTVIASTPLHQDAMVDRYRVVMMNNQFLKSAVASECESDFVELAEGRWYSLSRSTQVQQIDGYGTAAENKRAPGTGNGYLWALHTITRLEQRDGGVYMEVEALVLSRDVPSTLRWVVDPVIRKVAKNSLATSLRETADAVHGSRTPAMVSSVARVGMTRSFTKH